MQEIGIIEEIASGHEKDIKIFGFTIFPKTRGWLGIYKFYETGFWNWYKYKQLGTYHLDNVGDYKQGDKVKVVIEDKKIISVEKIGHLNGKEQFIHHPIVAMLLIGLLIIVLLAIFDIHVRL